MEQFYNPSKIIFNTDIKDIADIIYKFLNVYKKDNQQTQILLLTTQGTIKRNTINNIFYNNNDNNYNLKITTKTILPQPNVVLLNNICDELLKSQQCFDVIIAIGGGSVIDAAKFLSVGLLLDKKISKNFVETILLQQKQTINFSHNIPIIAIPTTIGTGSEVTPFATIWDNQNYKKYSLESTLLFPKITILSAQLVHNLPFNHLLFPILDSLSHSLETMWNLSANIFTKTLATQAIKIILQMLNTYFINSNQNQNQNHNIQIALKDLQALQQAAIMAGMAISQNHTAIAHSISYPLTLHKNIPHGLASSFTLKSILENVKNHPNFDLAIDIVNDVIHTLTKLNLQQYIYQYTNKTEILNLLPEMIDSSRAYNFIKFPMQQNAFEKYIAEILNSSLS